MFTKKDERRLTTAAKMTPFQELENDGFLGMKNNDDFDLKTETDFLFCWKS